MGYFVAKLKGSKFFAALKANGLEPKIWDEGLTFVVKDPEIAAQAVENINGSHRLVRKVLRTDFPLIEANNSFASNVTLPYEDMVFGESKVGRHAIPGNVIQIKKSNFIGEKLAHQPLTASEVDSVVNVLDTIAASEPQWLKSNARRAEKPSVEDSAETKSSSPPKTWSVDVGPRKGKRLGEGGGIASKDGNSFEL